MKTCDTGKVRFYDSPSVAEAGQSCYQTQSQRREYCQNFTTWNLMVQSSDPFCLFIQIQITRSAFLSSTTDHVNWPMKQQRGAMTARWRFSPRASSSRTINTFWTSALQCSIAMATAVQ